MESTLILSKVSFQYDQVLEDQPMILPTLASPETALGAKLENVLGFSMIMPDVLRYRSRLH
jgi:hypothetical protein